MIQKEKHRFFRFVCNETSPDVSCNPIEIQVCFSPINGFSLAIYMVFDIMFSSSLVLSNIQKIQLRIRSATVSIVVSNFDSTCSIWHDIIIMNMLAKFQNYVSLLKNNIKKLLRSQRYGLFNRFVVLFLVFVCLFCFCFC